MRTNSRSTSIRCLLVTRLYYSILYNRIEQFVRFLRRDDMHLRSTLSTLLIARN